MNKVVRVHYPVSRLPEDLRVGLPQNATVRVRIDVEDERPAMSLASLAGSLPNLHGTVQDVLAHVHSIRDDE